MIEWSEEMREIAHDWLFGDLGSVALPSTVLLPMENPDLHDPTPLHAPLARVHTYRSIAIGEYRGTTIGIASAKLGAPAVAMTVDLLASAGVKRILGMGFCGALQPEIMCGELAIPIAAIREPGVACHYVHLGYPAVADHELTESLRHIGSQAGARCHSGIVWSTDAILRETSALVDSWSERGCIGVDMETATLFTLSSLRGVRSAAVLVASDNPAARRRTKSDDLARGVAAAVTILLESAVS